MAPNRIYTYLHTLAQHDALLTSCRYRLRRLAAAQVQHHLRRKREAVSEKAGIDSALEPRPCVGRQAQLATGRADRLRTEIGAFDDDIGGRLGDARMLAAYDAADVVARCDLGNDGPRFVTAIGLAVQPTHRLPSPVIAGHERPAPLRQSLDLNRE